MKKDYYKILGVSRDATQEEIKRAFRRLAKQYHPDMASGNKKEAEEKFKEINEAFSVLGNPESRARYDQFGHAGVSGGFEGFNFKDFNFRDFFSDFGFDDIFNMFSGGKIKSGEDLRFDIDVTLEDVFHGTTKEIVLDRYEKCEACGGTGSKGRIKACKACGGSGEQKTVRRFGFAQFVSVSACRACNGSGKVAESECKTCRGAGRIRRKRKIEVKIPKGIEDGQFLRIQGCGNFLNGVYGDLFVAVHIKPHNIFERYENDLFCKVTISMVQAALGDEIEVPTMTGKAKLKIPAGTQSHTIFRLRGQGLAGGDQLVKVVVEIPRNLTRRQRQLLEEFGGKKVKVGKGFFERMKEYI